MLIALDYYCNGKYFDLVAEATCQWASGEQIGAVVVVHFELRFHQPIPTTTQIFYHTKLYWFGQ